MENLRERSAKELGGQGGGVGRDGGLADYMVVPSVRYLVPDDLDSVTAAPLTDAGRTHYHAIKRSLPDCGRTGAPWSSGSAVSAPSPSRSCAR